MDGAVIIFILLLVICAIALLGASIKLYLGARLKDIDGWRGLNKRKDFKNRKINKR